MKAHICLVSAQAAANLLPALDPQLKPEKIALVVSRKMEEQAEYLSCVFRECGLAVEQKKLRDEHSYLQTEEDLLELASRFENDEVVLNITGGTKLMSVAAQSVAHAYAWSMFYIDVDTDAVTWLVPKERPTHTLTEQLRLKHYLQSYGFALVKKPQRPNVTSAQYDLMTTLIRQIGSLEHSLSTLNWLAQQAENKNRLYADLDPQQQDSRGLEALLRNFSEAGALTVQHDRVCFSGEAERSFVKGGWLEQFVMQTVHQCTGPLAIRDKAVGLEVINREDVKNELDLVFMARNRLFVIECKTARLDRPEAPKANDALFKLAENCRRLGGLGARGMLISYRALREPEKKLAQALNIECVCGQEINRLDELLKAWVQPKVR